MGTVRMGEDDDYTYTIYLYCDECGSFSIATHIDSRTIVLIIGAAALVAVAYSMRRTTYAGFPFPEVICFSMVVLVLSMIGAFGHGHGHHCRKCKNRDIEVGNILEYPEYDGTKIDVPDKLIHKHYYFDAFPHPEVKLPFQ